MLKKVINKLKRKSNLKNIDQKQNYENYKNYDNKRLKQFSRCECIEDKKLIEEEWEKYKHDNAILIDVRSRQEFSEGHIEGAISIPYYELWKKANNQIKDNNTKIIIYCNTGSRTKKAEKILKKLGYINIDKIC